MLLRIGYWPAVSSAARFCRLSLMLDAEGMASTGCFPIDDPRSLPDEGSVGEPHRISAITLRTCGVSDGFGRGHHSGQPKKPLESVFRPAGRKRSGTLVASSASFLRTRITVGGHRWPKKHPTVMQLRGHHGRGFCWWARVRSNRPVLMDRDAAVLLRR
jgi:hypothetical protein